LASLPTGRKELTISIIRGYNFHLLYNGIKPNAVIRLPDLGLETQVADRTAEPIFNEQISLPLSGLMRLTVEAYHAPGDDSEDILIG
jgi:hypothetical protein